MAGTPSLRRKQLNDNDMAPIPQEVEAGQCPNRRISSTTVPST
jgi:hypothetical protein